MLLKQSIFPNISPVLIYCLNYLSRYDLFRDKFEIKKSRIYNLFAEENWKTLMMEEISLAKKNHLEIQFENDDLEDILEYICTS